MNSNQSNLAKAGLLNCDTGLSYADVTRTPTRAIGFCNSKRCSINFRATIKDVRRDQSYCPDCGDMLIFRRLSESGLDHMKRLELISADKLKKRTEHMESMRRKIRRGTPLEALPVSASSKGQVPEDSGS